MTRLLTDRVPEIASTGALLLVIVLGTLMPVQADGGHRPLAGPATATASSPRRTGVVPRARLLAGVSDFLYRHALRAMKFEARRAGVKIDTDLQMLLTSGVGATFLATVDGFEDLDLLEGGGEGTDVGFVYLQGAAEVPDGFYVMRFGIAPGDLDNAFVWLINARGERFRKPLQLAEDHHPEFGPRIVVTSEGASGADDFHYVYITLKSGTTYCGILIRSTI